MELNKSKIGLFIHISDDGDDWNSITTHATVKDAKEVLYSFVTDNWANFGISQEIYDLNHADAISHFFSIIDSSNYVICELGSTDLDNSVTYDSSY